MWRRKFLKSGAALAGAAAWSAGVGDADAATPRAQADGEDARSASSGRQRVLITAADLLLATAIAERLEGDYEVRLLRRQPAGGRDRWQTVVSDLGDNGSTDAAVHDVAAIVHLAAWEAPNAPAPEQIDLCTRATYNLLLAASQAGVKQVVYLSRLDVMHGYDPALAVAEDWQPRPGARPPAMSAWLGEFNCREFARENRLGVTVLRAESIDTAGTRDAAEAVALVLARRLQKSASGAAWQVFHIGGGDRFSTAKAQRMLGFKPGGDPAREKAAAAKEGQR
ncbi:MAG: NAD-dependent epimerase/dehydratase family protein [Planctomycetota bacterium]